MDQETMSNNRRSDLNIFEIPEGVRISGKKIYYISDRYINIGKESGYEKSYPRGKEYKATNKLSGEEYIGTSRELGAILFEQLAISSQIAGVNGLLHKRFKNSEGWIVENVEEEDMDIDSLNN